MKNFISAHFITSGRNVQRGKGKISFVAEELDIFCPLTFECFKNCIMKQMDGQEARKFRAGGKKIVLYLPLIIL